MKSTPVMDSMAINTAKSDKRLLTLPGKYPVFLKVFREKLIANVPVNSTADIKKMFGL